MGGVAIAVVVTPAYAFADSTKPQCANEKISWCYNTIECMKAGAQPNAIARPQRIAGNPVFFGICAHEPVERPRRRKNGGGGNVCVGHCIPPSALGPETGPPEAKYKRRKPIVTTTARFRGA